MGSGVFIFLIPQLHSFWLVRSACHMVLMIYDTARNRGLWAASFLPGAGRIWEVLFEFAPCFGG